MKKTIFLLLAGILLTASCVPATPILTATAALIPSHIPSLTRIYPPSRTPIPSVTPSPTLIPLLTSTPQPNLVAHEWKPEKVLISLGWANGDGCCTFPHSPPLILYADGIMFLTRYYQINDVYRSRILIKKLSRQGICQNLNTLDQTGFLDYDPSTYVFNDEPALEGGGSTQITVNAWKSIYGTFESLGPYISFQTQFQAQGSNGGKGFPVILPALRDAYLLFDNYPEDGFDVFLPEEFGLWLTRADNIQDSLYIKGTSLGAWPTRSISLGDLFSQNISSAENNIQTRFVKIQGDEGKELYDFVGQSFGDGDTVYEEQDDGSKHYYYVFVRPLLPYEKPSATDSDFSASDLAISGTKLACTPSDGIVPIPTPFIP